jgi:hypothetical protein
MSFQLPTSESASSKGSESAFARPRILRAAKVRLLRTNDSGGLLSALRPIIYAARGHLLLAVFFFSSSSSLAP